MKAIRVYQFGGPEVLSWEDIETPHPGPGQVLVKVRAAGVNPVEAYIRSGSYGDRPFPFTPGTDGAGIVAETGTGVSRVKAGDRVYTVGSLTGTYAEFCLCETSQVRPLGMHLSFNQGAAIHIPYATAFRALFHKARARGGETVLIHGASGGVGLASVQLARAAGLTVIGTAGMQKSRELILKEGAHSVLDHSDTEHLAKAMVLTKGKGVDIVIEMLSNVNLGADLKVLAKSGRIIIVGCRGEVSINPRDAMSRDAVIYGMLLANAPSEEKASILAALDAGLENGTLHPVVGRQFDFSLAPKAHQAVMQPGAYGKIILSECGS